MVTYPSSGGAAGNFILVSTQTLSSAGTTLTFSGLDGNSDGYYMAMINVTNDNGASGAELRVFVNSDSTLSNYRQQQLIAAGSTVSTAINSESTCASVSIDADVGGQITLWRSITGHFCARSMITANPDDISNFQNQGFAVTKSSATITNITQLDFVCSTNMESGSTISLYKLTTS